MSQDHDDEERRRELANEHRDQIDPMYAVPIKPKIRGTILSVRFPGDVAGRLRDYANDKGESVSDVLRRAALELIGEPAIGFRCRHVAIVSTPGTLQSASADCGCVMRKVFDPAELRAEVAP